uniref:C-type lectin domain-containing protein n=1 Tax=Xiphophorus couchianus TaxID=32473 RepID=A0A3B5KT83_9TELE
QSSGRNPATPAKPNPLPSNPKCQLCPDGWLRFQEKCYWFRNDTELNWEESRRFCQDRSADLVVINNPQQQRK